MNQFNYFSLTSSLIVSGDLLDFTWLDNQTNLQKLHLWNIKVWCQSKIYLTHLWAWHQLKPDDLNKNIVQKDINYQKRGLTSYSNQKAKFLDKLALSFWHWVGTQMSLPKSLSNKIIREKLSCLALEGVLIVQQHIIRKVVGTIKILVCQANDGFKRVLHHWWLCLCCFRAPWGQKCKSFR